MRQINSTSYGVKLRIIYKLNSLCNYSLNLQSASLVVVVEAPASVYPRRSFALGRLHMDYLHKLGSTYE